MNTFNDEDGIFSEFESSPSKFSLSGFEIKGR